MITVRKANDRGHADHGWLNTHHTFSFGSYRDPEHMGFRVLRVMNEDRVQADNGFGTHPHNNMEIISYVVSGKLQHEDSLGNGSVIEAGEFQVITAGTGITHSEFNPSKDSETHFYQMWVIPDTQDLEPAYSQKRFQGNSEGEQLTLVASKNPSNGALRVHQDIKLYLGQLAAGESIKLPLEKEHHGWLQVVKGTLNLEDQELHDSDGASLSDTQHPRLVAETDVEILFFDLP